MKLLNALFADKDGFVIQNHRDFTTSADVVMKASGLRLEAIRAIAREKGVEIEDTACRCIDEELLADFAEAHVRRLRAYFHNAQRHLAELTGDELATFVKFCNTFKKRHSSDSKSLLWSDIDTETIREQFIQKVHKLSPLPLLDAVLGNFVESKAIFKLCSVNTDISNVIDGQQPKEDILDKITQSYLYYVKPCNEQILYVDHRTEVKKTTLSARYHIFVSEDEDHLENMSDNYLYCLTCPNDGHLTIQ